MIWGMTLIPGVMHTREVLALEYLTLASLDCRPGMSSDGFDPIAHVKLLTNDTEHVLCTLEKGIVQQQRLDYVLQDGDSLKFAVEGNGIVHITGYTYRHPALRDTIHESTVTSEVVRVARDRIHDNLSPTSSSYSEGGQPRIIEGTVGSVKCEPVNGNSGVTQDGIGGQKEPQTEEHLTGTDEDFNEPEEERPDPESANTSSIQSADMSLVQGGTEEVSSQQSHKEHYIQTEITIGDANNNQNTQTITEGAVDNLDSEMSGTANTSCMRTEAEGGLDLESRRKTPLLNENVTESSVDSHVSEVIESLSLSKKDQMQQATDRDLIGADVTCPLSETEIMGGMVACQSVTDELSDSFAEDTVEEGVDALESPGNKEVRVLSVDDEDVTECEDRKTVKWRNEYQDKELLVPKNTYLNNTNLKLRKVTIVLHRIDRESLCHNGEKPVDCIEKQLEGKESLCQVEAGSSESTIENQTSEKETCTPASDMEMANILLEFHSGEWANHLQGSSLNSNTAIINGKEIGTGDSEAESCTCSRSPGICNEEDRLSDLRMQEPEVETTADGSQKINGHTLEKTISPDGGSSTTKYSKNETIDEHIDQHSNEKTPQKQLNRNKELTPTSIERQLRSSRKPSRSRSISTSLQDSAGNKLENVHACDKSYKCQVCKKTFTRKPDWIVHKKNHCGEKPFSCKYCEKTFTFQSYLLRHERSHTGEKPYSCKFCQKKFTMKSSVVAHEKIHTGEYPFQCKFCGKKFTRKSKMENHVNIHTGEKLFECTYCGKKFTMKSFLVCHERIHTGEKPFHCKYCVKKFVQKSHMEKHERTHTGEKPFSCKYCAKKFAWKSVLKFHERTHTGEKTFKCKYCDKMFTWRKNWMDHMKIHTGDRPYTCKYCDKKFYQKYILQQHEAIHTGEKRFKCQHCNKGFAWKNNLMRHERIHTGKKGGVT